MILYQLLFLINILILLISAIAISLLQISINSTEFRTELDDMIKDGDIDPAFEIFNTFKEQGA